MKLFVLVVIKSYIDMFKGRILMTANVIPVNTSPSGINQPHSHTWSTQAHL